MTPQEEMGIVTDGSRGRCFVEGAWAVPLRALRATAGAAGSGSVGIHAAVIVLTVRGVCLHFVLRG
jgi:hypothetical protein